MKEPWKVLTFSPTFSEREDFRELLPGEGYVPNVDFTTALIVDDGRTDVHKGICDEWSVLASCYTEDVDKFVRG